MKKLLKKRTTCDHCHCKMEVGTEIEWKQTLRANLSRKFAMTTGQVYVPVYADKKLCDELRAERWVK